MENTAIQSTYQNNASIDTDTHPNTLVSAAKGGRKMRNKSSLTVVGYVVRNGERVRRTELSAQEQQRLATVWSLKSMSEAGYVPVAEHRLGEGVIE